jgi:hypothetical protein
MNPQPDDKGNANRVQPAPEPSARENRAEVRRPASDVPAIKEVRIWPPRTEAVLINISEGGILAECGTRFQPGMQVTVGFVGGFSPASVSGRVARSAIAGMGPEGVRYQVGIAFTQKISLPELPAAPAAAAPAPDSKAPAAAEAAGESQPANAEGRPRVNRW